MKTSRWVPPTLIDLLRQRAIEQSTKQALTFLLDWQTESDTLTFEQLDLRARAIAALLQSVRADNERVLLLYPAGLEFVSGFLGCLYAGAVAVPVPPPRFNRNMDRLMLIAGDCRARFVLSTRSILDRIESLTDVEGKIKSLVWMATDDIDTRHADDWRTPVVGTHTLAFLQYTSGSTTTPKGVMVTHGNLIHNEGLIQEAFRQTDQSLILSWLPLYHDMGLIGGVLQPLFVGARCFLMSPLGFLRRPLGWLRAITKHGITTSGGPDFAYRLCALRAEHEECSSLDLSRWSVAFNGSESIRDQTIGRFTKAFEPFGFRRESFLPCYGLAEATLLVSGGRTSSRPLVARVLAQPLLDNHVVEAGADPQGTQVLVGSGGLGPDQEVAIVDVTTLTHLPSDRVGEIWIRGPSVAAGYYNRPEQSLGTFHAHMAAPGNGPFLRTGDLGFIRQGELFVTGRIKDLIIIRGQNYYPYDLEATVQNTCRATRLGAGAAFSIEADGDERLVIVQEVDSRAKASLDEVISMVRQSLVDEHELAPYAVVLIKQGGIARTSSGKIRREECRTDFLERRLRVLAEWHYTAAAERYDLGSIGDACTSGLEAAENALVSALSAKLGIRPEFIDRSRPISSYGLDSVDVIDLMHALETDLRVSMPITTFLQVPSIRELAKHLLMLLSAPSRLTKNPFTQQAATEFGLSRAQQALYLLHERVPDVPIYNIASLGMIRGAVDTTALRKGFQGLIDRHSSLRTNFTRTSSGPVQRIQQHMHVWFREVDADRWSSEDLNGHTTEEANHHFNLQEEALLRITLYKGRSESFLLIVVHHIVVDFWSLSQLLAELGALYSAETSGSAVALQTPVCQYSDFIDWQDQMLAGTEADRLWEYWKRKLAGELPALDLPSDHPRPPKQSYAGDSQNFAVPGEPAARLAQMSRERRTTRFTILAGAFSAFLHRYTGQNDILLGTPTSGRSIARFANVVGYFVNPVILRSCFSDVLTFDAFLSTVRTTVLEAFEHQDYPFPMLVENLNPGRDVSRPPLLQSMFVYQKAHLPNQEALTWLAVRDAGARITIGEIEVEALPLNRKVTELDLTLRLMATDDGISGSLDYNSDLFEGATIQRMARHFERLLTALLAEPERRISQVQMLSEGERHQLVVEWNRTDGDDGRPGCLHNLFEAQVERAPQALALVFDQQHISYCELDRRAKRLAHLLKSLEVGPDIVVGICIERGPGMIVAQISILKAGGAFLSLDPASPQERLALMTADAGLSLILTSSSIKARLPQAGVKLICLDSESEMNPPTGQAGFSRPVNPDNACYVVYTSGSTGVPKGVVITHRGLFNLTYWHRRAFRITSADRATQFAGNAFDASIWEVWPYLLSGASIHFVVWNEIGTPQRLKDWFVSRAITIGFLPTPVAELVIETDWPEGTPLRVLLTGGDRLHKYASPSLPFDLVNNYGPTEDTVVSTSCSVPLSTKSGNPPIGRPILNSQTYVVDQRLEAVPIGVAGELNVGGSGLARGYLNRAELTASHFVPDSFSAVPGSRLYKTGDLSRYTADGNIEFIGRTDYQVKLNGYRVELGEIECALNGHPMVAAAVVVLNNKQVGRIGLVAYLVPAAAQAALNIAELQAYLRERLPEYMVPASFLVLGEVPLTPNGKVDRNALPMPNAELEQGGSRRGPRTPIEEILMDIWRQVLLVDQVGSDDNFFDLGGHSLLATQVISRVRDVLEAELPLRLLFEQPTVAGLAEVIGQARESGRVVAPPIVPVSRARRIQLSLTQQRLWFFQQLDPCSTAFNISVGIRLAGSLSEMALEQALAAIIGRHEVLRTIVPTIDGEPVQAIGEVRPWLIPVVDTTELSEEDVQIQRSRLTREEQGLWFNLETDPLMRALLIRVAKDEFLLLITLHHIVADGWSMGVLVQESGAFYEAFSKGTPAPLSELYVQYADFTVWQRERIDGKVLDGHLSYWKRHLSGCQPLLELPSDRPRPPVQNYRGSRRATLLSDSLTSHLRQLSQCQGTTLFMTLMAAFSVLLHKYTGQEDVVVGIPIAGRNHKGTEELIGFFVNTLVIRTDLSGDPSFVELMRRVRNISLNAYDHQDVPFEKLIEELRPKRDLSYAPLFQVMLNMLDFGRKQLDLPGVVAEVMWPADLGSKLDLTLYVQTQDECTHVDFVYNSDLFSDERIAEMVEQFVYLISQIVINPNESISRYSLVTRTAEQLLPDPTVPLGEDWIGPVHKAFSFHAWNEPDSVAIVDQHESWTYRKLESSSNRLATSLLVAGIERGDFVAVYGHRSATLVLAVLGVLKAGAAFLIVDPTYPPVRVLEYMRSARPKGWIQIDAAGPAPAEVKDFTATIQCHIELASIGTVGEHPSPIGLSANKSIVDIGPNDSSYLAFTSGSSGKPKGVVGKHGSMAHFAPWARSAFGIGKSDRFSMLSAISHDPLHRDIFTPLQLGGTICIPGPNDMREPSELAQWIRRQGITVCGLTPAMGQLLTEGVLPASNFSGFISLRYAFFVGDVLRKTDVMRLQALAPSVTCINLYGATETGRAVGHFIIPSRKETGANQEVWARVVKEVLPIGKGIDGVQLLVVNRAGQRAGIGEIGEIWFRSSYLSLGYLESGPDPPQRFIANPFADTADQIYKTGDLGRYTPDGCIEFLGRADRQAKIRGFRIELAEIEAVLVMHPAVQDAHVMLRNDNSDDWRLVAYVVTGQDASAVASGLRAFLKDRLPDFMVPSRFVLLPQLPLTPNGKLDEKALPAPSTVHIENEAPPNTIENVVAGIWAEVLGLDRVGLNEDFFELGGHSLLATQIVSRIRAYFGVEVPLRFLFTAPTVAALAGFLADTNGIPQEKSQAMIPGRIDWELLTKVEQLSEDEAKALLSSETQDRDSIPRS